MVDKRTASALPNPKAISQIFGEFHKFNRYISSYIPSQTYFGYRKKKHTGSRFLNESELNHGYVVLRFPRKTIRLLVNIFQLTSAISTATGSINTEQRNRIN